VVYGDSVVADGSGNDMIVAVQGDNVIYRDSQSGTGSRDDTIMVGKGNNHTYGSVRRASGNSHLYRDRFFSYCIN
jgi:hypothetical protein